VAADRKRARDIVIQSGEKLCKRCGNKKPLRDFYPHSYSTNGRMAHCKDCTKDAVAKYSKTEGGAVRHRMAQRIRRKGSLPGKIAASEWLGLCDAYSVPGGVLCVYCSRPTANPTIDHVVPLVAGGQHTIENVVPGCKSCNSSKNDRPLMTWMWRRAIAHAI